MPVGCRIVEPNCLGAHSVPQESDEDKKCVLSAVANNAIVGSLLQLSSLVRHADDLFCDISDECQKVFERTDSLLKRIKNIDEAVGKLDAKQVPVPEGDLKQFTAVSEHHEARHGYTSHMFLPTNRPQCIQDQYVFCQLNPTRVIRSADTYRKDGLTGSRMFKCWPVMLDEETVKTTELDLPRRTKKVQRVRSFDKKYKQLKIRERPKTIHGWDGFNLDDSKKEVKEGEKKENECLTTTDPPVVVSIDTSGSNFERMQSLRLSGRRYQTKEEKDKKKKRRRTVSGVPENIMYEIEKFDKSKKVHGGAPRQTPRSYSFDDLDAEDHVERDEGIVKYLGEIEGKMEERSEEEKAQKLMKYFPCRRSRSLPRCMKLTSVTRSLSADRRSVRDLNNTYTSSSLSLSSMASSASSRLSRAAKRSSMLSTKLKSLVSGNGAKPRPKSLDIDTFLDSKGTKCSIEEQERSKSTYSLERNHTYRVPDNLLHQKFSEKSDSTIGPGSYYNFESSTLPRAQAKKYDFPWESLPKDWTTSVRLREISKRRAKEDRQSSSGNWSQSGTSSNRHSLDSDLRSEGLKFNSQYSLGKDSGRDSLTLEEHECVTGSSSTIGYAADGTSTITGDSVSIGNPKSDFTQLETEAWIQSLAIRAAKREEAQNGDKCSTLSRLTRQNILALDLMMTDDKARKITDEESSIYSVDQEGFYTSFHNDSGLKKSTNTLVDEDDISPSKDSQSICSAESVIHRPLKSDKSDKFAGLRKGNSSHAKVLSKVTPPTPPQRTSSGSQLGKEGDQFSPPELHSFPSQDSSISESSDPDSIFSRVQDKTTLSSSGFPSLVALSTSDDESSPDNASERLRKLSSKKCDSYIFNETDSDLALSDFRNSSTFSYFSYQSGSILDSCQGDSNFDITSSPLKHSKSAVECIDQGYDSLTLPKNCHTSKTVNSTEKSYQSWPRSHKATPTPGILKTPEKQFVNSAKPQKTLNFAPMVNLFKHGAQDSVQLPLPSPTNSSSSENSVNPLSQTSSFQASMSADQSYKLSVPIDKEGNSIRTIKEVKRSNPDLPLKYQPVITVTPRSRSSERQGMNMDNSGKQGRSEAVDKTPIYAKINGGPAAQSTPHSSVPSSNNAHTSPNLYAVSPVTAPKDPTRQSLANSGSGNPGYMDMQSSGSLRSAGSSSSLASSNCLNFNGDSTYMSMSSPSSSPNLSNMDFSISSTPSGSMDSLLDLRKTPTNELENDTYRINTNLHVNNHSEAHVRNPRGQTVNSGGNEQYNRANKSQESSRHAVNNSNASFSSYKSTPGRRSLDTSDLTRVTQLSNLSTPGSSAHSPMSQGSQSAKGQRQMGRQSRADTRKEPSYRSHNASNRRSLPTDMSNTYVYTRNVPLNDTKSMQKQSNPPKKSMSSSVSCPTGFHAPNGSVHNTRQATTPTGDQGASSRSDSYRAATGSRNGSYRVAMHGSKSFPVLPPTKRSGPYRVAMDMSPNRNLNGNDEDDDDVMSRADSYRIAVRNTNGIVPDVANRNSSYRVAVNDDIPSSVNSKLEALSMDHKKSTSGRDARRMGITDVDQAKDIGPRPSSKDGKTSPQTQNGGRIRKVTKQDVDPIQIVQTVDNNKSDARKSGKNNPNRSSTYIQFDPIFEDTEDFGNSLSGDLDMSSRDYSLNLSNTSKSKFSLINGTIKDANSNNVKGLRKSKSSKSIESASSGNNIEIEDNWRFSQV